MARSNVPGTPRKSSCDWASGPSRLIAMRETPHSWKRSMASSVSRGVALGVTLVRSPIRTLWRISSYRSGRFRGSPPVKTIRGLPNDLIWSSSSKPCAVFSSCGWRLDWADARQCTHAKSHAWVTSQMTSMGAWSKFIGSPPNATGCKGPSNSAATIRPLKYKGLHPPHLHAVGEIAQLQSVRMLPGAKMGAHGLAHPGDRAPDPAPLVARRHRRAAPDLDRSAGPPLPLGRRGDFQSTGCRGRGRRRGRREPEWGGTLVCVAEAGQRARRVLRVSLHRRCIRDRAAVRPAARLLGTRLGHRSIKHANPPLSRRASASLVRLSSSSLSHLCFRKPLL